MTRSGYYAHHNEELIGYFGHRSEIHDGTWVRHGSHLGETRSPYRILFMKLFESLNFMDIK